MRLALVVTLFAACDGGDEARAYLKARGHTDVSCYAPKQSSTVTCNADGVSFRCLVKNAGGCGGHDVACERLTAITSPEAAP